MTKPRVQPKGHLLQEACPACATYCDRFLLASNLLPRFLLHPLLLFLVLLCPAAPPEALTSPGVKVFMAALGAPAMLVLSPSPALLSLEPDLASAVLSSSVVAPCLGHCARSPGVSSKEQQDGLAVSRVLPPCWVRPQRTELGLGPQLPPAPEAFCW